MGKSLYKIKNMIENEIDGIAEKGELSAGSLETIDKLTHSLKSIETIMAMEDGGYSNDMYPHVYTRGYDYGRGRYSRDGMIDKLRSMMDEVSSEKDRKAIRECISKMEG